VALSAQFRRETSQGGYEQAKHGIGCRNSPGHEDQPPPRLLQALTETLRVSYICWPEAFASFINGKRLSANQIEFINLIIELHSPFS
jgi:hypothetical protein